MHNRGLKPSQAYVNWSLPITNGLVIAQPINEHGGNHTLRDLGPYKLNATPSGGSFVWTSERYGRNLAPDGTYSAKTVFDATTYGVGSSFSVSFLVKRYDTTANVGYFSWDTTASGHSAHPFIALHYSSAANLQWFFNDGDRVTVAHAAGAWIHYVVTYDGTTYKVYADGRLAGSYAGGTTNLANGNIFYLGDATTGPASCRFDHFYAWRRPLKQHEVAELTADPYAPFRHKRTALTWHDNTVAAISAPATNSLSLEQVRGLITSLLPPGQLYDLYNSGADFYKFLDGLAAAYKQYGFDLLDTVRTEFNPATCSQKLSDWEAALGLTATATAASGTDAQRQNAIIGKLRESGASTIPNIQASVGAALGYTDPTQLVVYETPRSTFASAHTFSGSPGSSFTSTPATARFFVTDGNVSVAGVHQTITITHANVENVSVTLTAPNGYAVTWTDLGTGSVTSRSYILYDIGSNASPSAGFIGQPMEGFWTLSVSASAGTGTLVSWSWFGEGGGINGLGGDIYYWGVYADSVLVHGPDYPAARDQVARLRPAHTYGAVLLSISPDPDDTTTLPDSCIPV